MNIDLLLLSRDLSPPRPDVWNGILAQEGVTLRVIRVTGPACPGDRSRFETIARARNAGKRLASSPLVMLLDDDVVLGPRCVARLAEGLISRPEFAALAADSAGEMNDGLGPLGLPSACRHGRGPVPSRATRGAHLPLGALEVRMPVLLRRPPPCRVRHRLPARGRSLAQALAEHRPSSRRPKVSPNRTHPEPGAATVGDGPGGRNTVPSGADPGRL